MADFRQTGNAMDVGFIGIGTMGLPMAGRLLAAGVPLHVWNRTAAKCAPLVERGAVLAPSVDELFARCGIVMLMLLDRHAVDAVLGRGSPAFARRVGGRTIVALGTTPAGHSSALEADIHACGGEYVEAPVSGSRVPAEQGALVGMMAGDEAGVRRVEPLLAPLCRDLVRCGAVPNALRLKLAVNHYLILIVAALAEATRAAEAGGVDLALFRQVLDAGPMASAVSRGKLEKLVQRDFTPQAAIRDVAQIATLVVEQAHAAGADAPLIAACEHLFAAARERGLSDLDMAAVLQPPPGPA